MTQAAAMPRVVRIEAESNEGGPVLGVVVGVGAGAYVAGDAYWVAVEDGEAEPLVALGLVWGVGCTAAAVGYCLAVVTSACAVEDVVTARA